MVLEFLIIIWLYVSGAHIDWKVLVYECGYYGICWLAGYEKSLWTSCEVINYGEDVFIAWTGGFTFYDQINGYLI